MKKIIFTAAAIMIGTAAFSQTGKSNTEFQKYIAKNLSYNTSFAKNGTEGTVRVRVSVSPTGIEVVDILSGINAAIDQEVVTMIRNTPNKIVSNMVDEKTVSMIVPVKFVIKEN